MEMQSRPFLNDVAFLTRLNAEKTSIWYDMDW